MEGGSPQKREPDRGDPLGEGPGPGDGLRPLPRRRRRVSGGKADGGGGEGYRLGLGRGQGPVHQRVGEEGGGLSLDLRRGLERAGGGAGEGLSLARHHRQRQAPKLPRPPAEAGKQPRRRPPLGPDLLPRGEGPDGGTRSGDPPLLRLASVPPAPDRQDQGAGGDRRRLPHRDQEKGGGLRGVSKPSRVHQGKSDRQRPHRRLLRKRG